MRRTNESLQTGKQFNPKPSMQKHPQEQHPRSRFKNKKGTSFESRPGWGVPPGLQALQHEDAVLAEAPRLLLRSDSELSSTPKLVIFFIVMTKSKRRLALRLTAHSPLSPPLRPGGKYTGEGDFLNRDISRLFYSLPWVGQSLRIHLRKAPFFTTRGLLLLLVVGVAQGHQLPHPPEFRLRLLRQLPLRTFNTPSRQA